MRPLSLDSASFGTVSLIVTRRLAREVSACSKNSKDSVTRMVSGEGYALDGDSRHTDLTLRREAQGDEIIAAQRSHACLDCFRHIVSRATVESNEGSYSSWKGIRRRDAR